MACLYHSEDELKETKLDLRETKARLKEAQLRGMEGGESGGSGREMNKGRAFSEEQLAGFKDLMEGTYGLVTMNPAFSVLRRVYAAAGFSQLRRLTFWVSSWSLSSWLSLPATARHRRSLYLLLNCYGACREAMNAHVIVVEELQQLKQLVRGVLHAGGGEAEAATRSGAGGAKLVGGGSINNVGGGANVGAGQWVKMANLGSPSQEEVWHHTGTHAIRTHPPPGFVDPPEHEIKRGQITRHTPDGRPQSASGVMVSWGADEKNGHDVNLNDDDASSVTSRHHMATGAGQYMPPPHGLQAHGGGYGGPAPVSGAPTLSRGQQAQLDATLATEQRSAGQRQRLHP